MFLGLLLNLYEMKIQQAYAQGADFYTTKPSPVPLCLDMHGV